MSTVDVWKIFIEFEMQCKLFIDCFWSSKAPGFERYQQGAYYNVILVVIVESREISLIKKWHIEVAPVSTLPYQNQSKQQH